MVLFKQEPWSLDSTGLLLRVTILGKPFSALYIHTYIYIYTCKSMMVT